MRKIRLLVVGALSAAALAVGVSAALATCHHAKFRCTGTLASGTYHKLVVPAGAECDGTEAKIDVRGGSASTRAGRSFWAARSLARTPARSAAGCARRLPASLQVHFAHIKGGV